MITIHDTPYEFSPSHNKQMFSFSSTTTGTDGFEFIIDLYDAETDEILARNYRPRWPSSSFAAFSPHGQLKNLVLRAQDITSVDQAFFTAPNSYLKYKLKIGERYTSWNYDDYYFGFSGGTIFSSSTLPHNFTIGSQIVVNHDSATEYPQYSGRFSVIGVPDQFSIEVNTAFQSGPVIGGIVKYSDNSFIEVTDVTATTVFTAFAAAIDEQDYINYTDQDYIYGATAGAKELLSLVPDNFRIDHEGSFYVYSPSFSGSATGIFLQTYRANGSTISTYRILFSSITSFEPCYIGVGPHQLNNLPAGAINTISGLGSSQPITSIVDSYKLFLTNISETQLTSPKRFYVTRECTKFGKVHLMFQDRLGSWGSFNFDLRRRNNISTRKS